MKHCVASQRTDGTGLESETRSKHQVRVKRKGKIRRNELNFKVNKDEWDKMYFGPPHDLCSVSTAVRAREMYHEPRASPDTSLNEVEKCQQII